MNSFSPAFSQSSEITRLENNLANAQVYTKNLIQPPNVVDSKAHNVSIPSDPSSLSSMESQQNSPNVYANIKYQNQKEVINQLQNQIKSFISYVNAECQQNFDTLNACSKFVGEYFKPVQNMKKLQELYANQKVENESLKNQLFDAKKENKKLQKKDKEVLQLLKQLREYTKEQESIIANQSAKINELNLELTKKQTNPINFPVKTVNITNKFPVSQIEDLLETQSKEIIELSNQRNQMIKNFQILEEVSKIPLELPKKADEVKKIEAKSINTVNNFVQTEDIKPIIQKEIVKNYDREILSTVFECLQNLAFSVPKSDTTGMRADLISQLSRINRYIDDHSILLKKPDLHFLNMINDEELKNSPLYDVFVCVVNILNVILNLEKQPPKTVMVEDPELKKNNEELRNELIGFQASICQILKCKTSEIVSKINNLIEDKKQLKSDLKKVGNEARKLTIDTKNLEKDVVNKTNQQKKDKKRFTSLATKMLDEISESVKKQTKEYESKIFDLDRRLDSANTMVLKLKEQTEKEKFDFNSALDSKNMIIQKKGEEMEQYTKMREIENQEKDKVIEIMHKKIENMKEKLTKEKHSNEEFQLELDKLNDERESVFSMLMKKNCELAELIDEQRKQSDLEIQKITATLHKKLDEIQTKNVNLVRENSKIKASEQTSKMKLEELNRQLLLEKSHFDAKASALTVKAQNTVGNIRTQFTMIISEIAAKLGLVFENLSETVPKIHEIIDERTKNEPILLDALSTRTHFQISPQKSLLDYISSYKNEISLQQRNYSETTNKNSEKIEKLESELECSQNAIQKVNEWKYWCSSLLKQIKETHDPNMPEKLARKEIEELLLFCMKEKMTMRKLECLRKEKIILLNYSELLDPIDKWRHNICSMRPAVAVVICVKRLMKMSGTVPVVLSIKALND